MTWVEPYAAVKKHVVAIISIFEKGPGDFPTIIGTGFLSSSEGVVCTCKHVADAIGELPRPKNFKGYPVRALMLVETKADGKPDWAMLALDVLGIGHATVFGDTKGYVGPNPPDIAYLLLDARETPALAISEAPLQEGEEVAFAGYPMGRDLLKAPGWLHHIGPTLHTGVVGAILPHNRVEIPHGFIVHANTQGGASGSPVFRKDGRVVGILYGGVHDQWAFGGGEGDKGMTVYQVPTSVSLCMSREILARVLPLVEKDAAKETGRKTLAEFIEKEPKLVHPGENIFSKWEESEP